MEPDTVATTGADDDRDDDIAPVKSEDGWVWVDTNGDTAERTVVEELEVVEYAVALKTINGVKHLRFAGVECEDSSYELSSDRTIESSYWYDLDEMR